MHSLRDLLKPHISSPATNWSLIAFYQILDET
jgi:hypothetical protein